MKNLLVITAVAASFAAPAAVQAQALPAAVIAVTDNARVSTECNACKTAAATLRSQESALQARAKALADPLQTEQRSIQAAIDALNGGVPDAALQARVKAFQTKQQSAATEIQNAQTSLQRNAAYVEQQIVTKLSPIYQQVMQRRGANIMMEVSQTLAVANSVDVTNEVLAALNAALPSISTTAPAVQQTPQSR